MLGPSRGPNSASLSRAVDAVDYCKWGRPTKRRGEHLPRCASLWLDEVALHWRSSFEFGRLTRDILHVELAKHASDPF